MRTIISSDCNAQLASVKMLFSCVVIVILVTSCAPSVEEVSDSKLVEDSRTPYKIAELEAVNELLFEGGHEPLVEPVLSAHGAVVALPDGVVSIDGETVSEAWRYPVEHVTDIGVTPEGSVVVVQYEQSVGPLVYSWLVGLDAEDGSLLESQWELGASVSDLGELGADYRFLIEEDSSVMAYPLVGSGVEWEKDLHASCDSGPATDVQVVAWVENAVMAFSCAGDNEVHILLADEETGDLVLEHSWDGTAVPEVSVSRAKDVPGGPHEPVSKVFSDGVTGDTLFLDAGRFRDSFSLRDPEPWSYVPVVSDYLDQPLTNMDELPERVILSEHRNLHDLMVIRSVHALVLDESIPFSESDVDETLKFDGELAENPAQWVSHLPVYIVGLRDNIEDALS